MLDYQVVIAGGGPVGLAAAVELGRRGVQVLVVEPRVTVSHARPRCKTINVRSMEHLRRWGLSGELRRRAPLATSWSQDVVFCTSLMGWELSRFSGVLGLVADGDRFPELGQQAPQYVLEELLRDTVNDLPTCTLAVGKTVTDVDQDEHEVRVRVTDAGGTATLVSAEYLVGCDGPRSTVRDCIGVDYTGEQALRPNFGLVFRAPELSQRIRHGPAVQYWIINAQAPALLGPIEPGGTWWMIAFGVDAETGKRDAKRLIDAAAGTSLDAEVLSTDPWTARMQVVDRMRRGRVFLAGDAAHLNPPFGGHGLNTGLGDGVDLGWKLAAVLAGWGGPALLDSYEQERCPIQERVVREATANMAITSPELLAPGLDADSPVGRDARALAGDRIQKTKHAEFHALDLVLDVRLQGSPIVGGDAGLAGRRLPHAWLGERSVYDELGDGFTVLVLAPAGETQADLLVRAGAAHGVPMKKLTVPLRDRYGNDLVIVRPDQYVAWAGDRAGDPDRIMEQVSGHT